MKLLATLSLAIPLTHCSPVGEPSPLRTTPPLPPQAAEAPAEVAKPNTPNHPTSAPRVTKRECSGVLFEGVSFDSRNHKLVVLDQAEGPGSTFSSAAAAGRSRNALAAVNASFFTPQGTPLGLVISSRKRAGSWNSASSLGSGIWCEDSSGHMQIIRRETLGASAASSMRELIQAGPMLVENGRAVGGLNAEKSGVRTLILWDGGTRWWIGRTSFCTLAKAAAAASQGQPASWAVRHALNLDGGRSTDLWISSNVSGGPASWHTPFNKPVRNFLVLLPR